MGIGLGELHAVGMMRDEIKIRATQPRLAEFVSRNAISGVGIRTALCLSVYSSNKY